MSIACMNINSNGEGGVCEYEQNGRKLKQIDRSIDGKEIKGGNHSGMTCGNITSGQSVVSIPEMKHH